MKTIIKWTASNRVWKLSGLSGNVDLEKSGFNQSVLRVANNMHVIIIISCCAWMDTVI